MEVFRSIVKQLATNKGGSGLEPVLTDKYRQLQQSRIEEPQRLSRKECVEMVISLVKHIPTSIIIDALDECKPVEVRSLILGLDEIVGSSKNVKVFLSTRYVAVVVDCLNQKDYRSLEVSANKNSGDIANFIDAELEKMIQDKRLAHGKVSDILRFEIRDTLTRRADSMFWYASLQLNLLSDPIAYQDEDGIKTKLHELPDTLRKAYVEIIGEIQKPSNSPQSRLIAQNSLKWLLCAQEPLTCAAFLQAVSPRSDIEVDQELITRLCRSLVIYNRENDVFEFAHLSVREYLEDHSDYGSDEQHLVVAESCLNSLEAALFSNATNRKTAHSRKAFSRYASLFWPLHYQNIDFDRYDVRKEALKDKLKTLLIRSSGVSPAFKQWISQIEGMAQDLADDQPLTMKLGSLRALPDKPDTPLFTACVFGFADMVKQFRRNKTFDFEQCNGHGQAALCLAAENNQLDTVKALLADLSKSHAPPLDVNQVNELAVIQLADFTQISPPSVICYASALQAAAAQGHVGMTKHLLERGARVDLVAGYYGNALQAAALRGHDSIVELLLEEYGAEPNSQGGFHGNALQAAAISGNPRSVTLLMDKYALVSAPGGHYGSAIMGAVCSGSKAIVEALVEQGANMNVKSSLYGTLLQRAADMDNQELLELLIANDAQINAHNTTSSEAGQAGSDSALAAAAWGGHHKIVHLILQHGAQADTTARENALHILHQAAARGMVELAEYCLNQEDCDINMTTTQGQKYYSNQDKMTPLSFACAEGHLDMVRLLLDNRASIEFPGDTLTTLWLAARRGNSDIIKRLIRQSTTTQGKVKTQQFIDRVIPKFDHSALYEAAWSGSVDAIATLLDNNAMYAGDWTSINPLHIATIENRLEVVRFLLERHEQNRIRGDFSTDSGDINGKTPLIYAIEHNHRAVFEILLEHGANTSANDNSGNSTLHYAVWRDRREITEKLLSACPRDRLQTLLEKRINKTNTVLNEALERGHYQILKVLLAYGARWHSDEGRESHLHHAATKDENIVRECIKAFEGSDELDAFLNSRTPHRRVPLHVAAENNKAKIAQILLDNGADPAALDNTLRTALFWATDRDHVECARVILNFVQKNSDRFNEFVNTRNAYARTALDEAIRRRHLASVQLLIDFGADFVNPGFNKETPLILTALDGHRAGYQKCASIAKLLLEKAQEKNVVRPFIDLCTEEGRIALWEASNNNVQEVVALLRERGADYAISSKEEVTPLHISCWNSHQKIVEMLLESSSMDPQQGKFRTFLDQRDGFGRTALSAASYKGQVGIVSLLLEKYRADYSIATPSYIPDSLITPLHYAVFEGHTTTVEALLQVTSLDPDHSKAQQFLDARQTSNYTSRTALMDAALRGMSSIVEALLTHGADFWLRDEGQSTALHAAVWVRHNEGVAIVKALISSASKCSDKLKVETFLNAKNKKTKTALMDAAERDHASIISVLLKAPGLDYAILDKDGFTALHWAAYRNNHGAVEALLEFASKDTTNNGQKFKDFLNHCGYANSASAIMDTATAGHWELTKFLLEGYGAEYETYDKSGDTPLHGAVDRKSYENAKVLLDFASKDKDKQKFNRFLNKAGRSGQTALDRATAGNKGHLMGLLKSYGAK